ncbi:hypothetical protein V5O48_004786 [Marasmius crinis-equi]|uniref:Uncharacterized protein n=1 Tax=Marasmius crinis-equi TaxID=585013 RepID=A0ABR3FP14_9AGAR
MHTVSASGTLSTGSTLHSWLFSKLDRRFLSMGSSRSRPRFCDWEYRDGYGTRLIPDGAITGAHFVQTPDFVQITGVGNLTFLNIPAADEGGELDPHGQDGNGNPIGGLVFSSAFGQLQEIFEWTHRWHRLSASTFTMRWDVHGICPQVTTRGRLRGVKGRVENRWESMAARPSTKGIL